MDRECAYCGIAFAVSEAWEQRLRNEHKGFFCPNGHNNIFEGETEAERVRREMQAKLDAKQRSAEWWRGQATTEKKNASIAKANLTRMKNRVNAGVCPYCNRTFWKLAAHMKCKHAENACG